MPRGDSRGYAAAPNSMRRQAVKETIAQNEAAVENSKTYLRALEYKRYQLLETLNSTSTIMAMLTPEILSEIFTIVCEGESGIYSLPRQFRLGRVCRAWRRIAWDTPRLWCRVGISLTKKHYETQRILLEDWVKRSGNCPLEISLRRRWTDQWDIPIDSTLQYLMTTCHRWTKLEIFQLFSIATLLEQHRPHFPLLEELNLGFAKLANGSDRRLDRWNFHSRTPRLRVLDVGDYVPGPQLGVNWESLVKLSATLSFQYQPSLELLALLPSLEELHCTLRDYNPDFHGNFSVPKFSRLSVLHMVGHPKLVVHLSRLLTIPKLVKLSITCAASPHRILWTTAIADLIERSSCQLEELFVEQSNITDEGPILDLLGKTSPSLRTLWLYLSPTFTISDRILQRFNLTLGRSQGQHEQYFPHLKDLVLQGNISFTLKALLRMLNSRRRSQQIDTEDSESGDEDVEDEADDKADGSSTSTDESRPGVAERAEKSKFYVSICYLNLIWYKSINPNKMRDFHEKVAKYTDDGVSLFMNWENPDGFDSDSDDESEIE